IVRPRPPSRRKPPRSSQSRPDCDKPFMATSHDGMGVSRAIGSASVGRIRIGSLGAGVCRGGVPSTADAAGPASFRGRRIAVSGTEFKPEGTKGGDGSAPLRALFRRVEDVFFEVVALPPAEREAAITRLCDGDTEAARRVRQLINARSRLGSFLEQPVLGPELDRFARETGIREPADELIGATLGPFRIARRIASCGMGTVYQAERCDGQFEQTVAIKVVKRGMDTEEILRRFRAERQTLAALDHPHIARLLDGGVTPDGRPYLVMEYVGGKPIDVYCDEHRLKIRERLALFRAVCDGVHHAHQNLVIHRDLKPSNILVTPQGVPKLLDFGIAKVLSGSTGAELLTTETDRRLTPQYASPAQVQGQSVTTATDVYSLAVILYELLTGSPPYARAGKGTEELRRIVGGVMPAPPSAVVTGRASPRTATRNGQLTPATAGDGPSVGDPAAVNLPATRGVSSTRLRHQLRGDLDNIVLTALRKE